MQLFGCYQFTWKDKGTLQSLLSDKGTLQSLLSVTLSFIMDGLVEPIELLTKAHFLLKTKKNYGSNTSLN